LQGKNRKDESREVNIAERFASALVVPFERELVSLEIKEARAYTFVLRFVDIVPVDAGKTGRHASAFTLMNYWCNVASVPLMRLFGCFMAPIDVPADWLPLCPEEIVEQIELRRAHALGLPKEGEGENNDIKKLRS